MWTVFRGCGYSFHNVCILPDISDCPICRIALLAKVKDLGQTAKNSVSNVSVTSASEDSDNTDDEDDNLTDDDDDEDSQLDDVQNENVTNIDTLLQRIGSWRTLDSLGWPARMASDKLDMLSLFLTYSGKNETNERKERNASST